MCMLSQDINGDVRCPALKAHKCPICDATGKFAHTIRYCPDNRANGGRGFNHCVFCKNNGQPAALYNSHTLKVRHSGSYLFMLNKLRFINFFSGRRTGRHEQPCAEVVPVPDLRRNRQGCPHRQVLPGQQRKRRRRDDDAAGPAGAVLQQPGGRHDSERGFYCPDTDSI